MRAFNCSRKTSLKRWRDSWCGIQRGINGVVNASEELSRPVSFRRNTEIAVALINFEIKPRHVLLKPGHELINITQVLLPAVSRIERDVGEKCGVSTTTSTFLITVNPINCAHFIVIFLRKKNCSLFLFRIKPYFSDFRFHYLKYGLIVAFCCKCNLTEPGACFFEIFLKTRKILCMILFFITGIVTKHCSGNFINCLWWYYCILATTYGHHIVFYCLPIMLYFLYSHVHTPATPLPITNLLLA